MTLLPDSTSVASQEFAASCMDSLSSSAGSSLVSSVYAFSSVSSTMDAAKALLEGGAESVSSYKIGELNGSSKSENAILIASEQSSGRGRGESTWFSPATGGLYFSLLLFPGVKVDSMLGVSLVVGLSVCKALRNCGADCGIKWPNDVVVCGTDEPASQKLSGVLVESSIQENTTKSLIIGVGVNVSQDEFPIDIKATSLKTLVGVDFEPSRVLAEIMQNFEKDFSLLLEHGFDALIPQWSEHSVLLGSEVKINVDYDGGLKAPVEGRVRNIQSDGALMIAEAAGKPPVAVYSGEFLEIRSGFSGGVSVRQILNQLVDKIEEEEVSAEEIKSDFENTDVISKEMLVDDGSDSQNLAGMIRDMKLGEKVKLGLLGNMTARALLIRSTNRLVRAAVMSNPRLSDNEVLDFARNANTEDQVLRIIVKNKA